MRRIKFLDEEAWIKQFFGYTEFAKTQPQYAKDEDGKPFHEGLDVGLKNGGESGLWAIMDGEVMWAGWGDTYGHNVIVYDKDHRISFRFCHLHHYDVATGDRVRVGDKLGVIGNSGKSVATHLHMNTIPMWSYGKRAEPDNGFGGRVNPLPILFAYGADI
jgi:murein DD-endopeptidase MepM/ murein hydrolase activator NlpD